MSDEVHLKQPNAPTQAACDSADPHSLISAGDYFTILVDSIRARGPRPANMCDKCHHHYLLLLRNVTFQARKSTIAFAGTPPFHCPYDGTHRVGERVWGDHGEDVYNRGD